jgi:hypothetical protein
MKEPIKSDEYTDRHSELWDFEDLENVFKITELYYIKGARITILNKTTGQILY